MPIGTAVHEGVIKLCESMNFREWSGYYAASVYEMHHDHEYNAIRNAAALIDVTPLFKYRISGKDATKFVNRVITRDINKVAVGQVIYCCWCDEQGKVIDDGTISRLEENVYRWTAADPSMRWFHQNALGLDVQIEDISNEVAALALQGPTSGRLLKQVAEADITNLKYFRVTHGKIAGVEVDISRTGYTGDLGYEIWMPWNDAPRVWDALVENGRPIRSASRRGCWRWTWRAIEAGLIIDRGGLFQQQEGADRVAEIFAVRNRPGAAGGFEEGIFHRARGAGGGEPSRAEAAADGAGYQLGRRGAALRRDRACAASAEHGFAHAGAGVSRRIAGGQGDFDDMVTHAEENDCAGEHQPRACGGRNGTADGTDGGGGAS